MKKSLPVLLILIYLLCGCAAGTHTDNSAAFPVQTSAAVPGYYDPDSMLEAQTNGALRCYPLGVTGAVSFRLLPDRRLLWIAFDSDATTLTILEGQECIPISTLRLPFSLQGTEYAIQPCGDGLSCFDPVSRETLVLNAELQETDRVSAPAGLDGIPLLSRDGSRLYYTADNALRVLERSSGISSVLKRSSTTQFPTSLVLDGAALVCREENASGVHTLLVSTQTGATLYSTHADEEIDAAESVFYVRYDSTLLYGAVEGPLWELLPAETSGKIFPLPSCHCAISLSQTSGNDIVLSRYDLSTGLRSAALTLPPGDPPQSFLAAEDGKIWFWRFDPYYGCNTLYCWDPAASPSGDTGVYASQYYSREAPDEEGTARCRAYARELEQRYGITLRLFQEADDVQPTGYRLEYEYRAERTMQSLELLDRSLQQYPQGFLDTVSQPFAGLTVCLVADIHGAPEWGTLDTLPGIQFWDGNHAYIALAMGNGIQGALYHQLCHLIDTVVYTHSSAYDTWQSLNPSGFEYDYSYLANQSRNSTAYLWEDRRAFVDMFSMSFPKEDRARIMEYAMLPGNEGMFRASVMQAKLKKLCLGIREAFELEDAPEVFLWEQYLDRPLGPTA